MMGQKAIVVHSTSEARRIAHQMGFERGSLISREWVIVPMGDENAVRGRRFDLVLITDDARRSVNPDAMQSYASRLETRLTQEGNLVFL